MTSHSDSSSESSAVAARFDFAAARRALLAWFDVNGRKFPWRDEPTPYRVWISEIMLQQTTTQTVAGYFERFIARFPDVETLARADEAEILKYWEGLGYYRRARALGAAARVIVDRFGGVFPNQLDDVLELPGVGRYASGAILSFGLDLRFPILEANTTRLHARLLALRQEPARSAAQRVLWKFAEDWLPRESNRRAPNVYRRLNGALTDLGRLICAPSEPRCDACPLARLCETKRLGLQASIPVARKKSATIFRTDVALWISRGDLTTETGPASSDVLLIRRREGELWAGLWDFPRFESPDERVDAPETRDKLQFFLEEDVGAIPFDRRPGEILTTVRHAVTKYRVALHLCRLAGAAPGVKRTRTFFDAPEKASKAPKLARLEPDFAPSASRVEWRWVPIDELEGIPLSSPGRKLARFIAENAVR